jgi:hypothetical protein
VEGAGVAGVVGGPMVGVFACPLEKVK